MSEHPAHGAFAAVVGLRPDVTLPEVVPVQRRAPVQPQVDDVPAAVREALEPLRSRIKPRMGVAVTAGSRGIHDIAAVITAAVTWLREAGAEPFVVSAMGSHGGATAEGQREVLVDLGIEEARVGAPVHTGVETVEIGRLPDGSPVHHDAVAARADGVLLINRVKPHTDFRGPAESGLAKIAAVGLGNHRGATSLHAGGVAQLGHAILDAFEVIRGHGHLLGGLGIVENSAERTAEIVLVPPEEIGGDGEKRLLERAAALLGRLPFTDLDVLVVDETGKDKSGTGMDTNVLGRTWVPRVRELDSPQITVVTVHSLTPASHGNAAGLGLADIVPLRLLEQVDVRTTYVNSITSGTGGLRRSRFPMTLADDDAVLRAAVAMCGRRDPAEVRLARISDTLTPGRLLVSPALLDEVAAADDLEVVGPAQPLVDDTLCLTQFPPQEDPQP